MVHSHSAGAHCDACAQLGLMHANPMIRGSAGQGKATLERQEKHRHAVSGKQCPANAMSRSYLPMPWRTKRAASRSSTALCRSTPALLFQAEDPGFARSYTDQNPAEVGYQRQQTTGWPSTRTHFVAAILCRMAISLARQRKHATTHSAAVLLVSRVALARTSKRGYCISQIDRRGPLRLVMRRRSESRPEMFARRSSQIGDQGLSPPTISGNVSPKKKGKRSERSGARQVTCSAPRA